MNLFLFFVTFFLMGNFFAFGEIFQGEVVEVDRSLGTITVQNQSQTPNGTLLERRVFVLQPQVTNFAALNTVDVGEEIHTNAQNQGGVWQVQSMLTNPLSTNSSVFVSAPLTTTTSPYVLLSQPTLSSTPVSAVSSSPTGINTFNSTFSGTTITPTGVTSTGGTGTTSSGLPGTTTVSSASGVPTRNGAQGTSQSL